MEHEHGDIQSGRRAFLKRIGQYGAVAMVGGAGAAVGFAGAVVTGLASKIGESLAKPFLGKVESFAEHFAHEDLGFVPAVSGEAQRLAKRLLFGTGDEVSIFPSQHNLYTNEVGLSAASKFLGDRLKGILADSQRHFKSSRELRVRDLHGNLLLLGGPIGNELTRKIMGINGRSQLVDEHLDNIQLRFPCWLDYNASVRAIKQGHFISAPKGPIPVWHNITPDGLLVPEHSNGKLRSDYLHIVSFPNVFSSRAFDLRRRVTIAIGVHGAGLRSLALLLSNEKLLEELLTKTEKMRAWYAIIAVDRLDDSGDYPLSLASKPIIYKVHGKFGKVAELLTRESEVVSRA